MRNLANFLLFQIAWFVTVDSAAGGRPWTGPLAVLLVSLLHLRFVARPGERGTEGLSLLWVGALGTLLDTGLRSVDVTRYPISGSDVGLPLLPGSVPLWISSLWVLFATLPRHSLAWLRGRPALAALFGAIGGASSYFAGTRIGAVAVGEDALRTYGVLALEYALVTPFLLWVSQRGEATGIPEQRD